MDVGICASCACYEQLHCAASNKISIALGVRVNTLLQLGLLAAGRAAKCDNCEVACKYASSIANHHYILKLLRNIRFAYLEKAVGLRVLL